MYSILQAFKNIFQNKFISFISVLSIALVFTFINLISSINYFSLEFIETSSSKIENQIYLKNTTSENLDSISDYLYSFENLEFNIINEKEGLENLSQKYPNLENFLEKNQISNPLPQTIVIKSQDLSTFEKIKNEITIKFPENYDNTLNSKTNASLKPIINNLLTFQNLSNKILLISTLSLVIISTLILIISIRNNFHTRKNEIQIMQMLGARYSKIQNPIILESNIIILTGLLIGLYISTYLTQLLAIKIDKDLLINFITLEILISIFIASILSIIICKKQLKKERLIHDL
tara:strand:- start:5817 stop:6692 length:876 start_codon:yes stop_codon:yes gene_type:complete